MVARAKKFQGPSPLLLVVIAVLALIGVFAFSSKTVRSPTTNNETPKPAATAKTTVSKVTSGPIGANFLIAGTGPKSGQVTLSWVKAASDTDKYSILYGTVPGKYTYGAVNAVTVISGVTNYSYMVGSLTSGKKYYFAILPQKGGEGTIVSPEVSVVAP